jgi:arsenate reductase-like glutaredoxin family protein
MKTKSFHKYLEKRLTQEEIAEIKQQAQLEVEVLRSLQKTSVLNNKQ